MILVVSSSIYPLSTSIYGYGTNMHSGVVATNLVLIIPQHKEEPSLEILAAICTYKKGNVNLRKPVWVYVC